MMNLFPFIILAGDVEKGWGRLYRWPLDREIRNAHPTKQLFSTVTKQKNGNQTFILSKYSSFLLILR